MSPATIEQRRVALERANDVRRRRARYQRRLRLSSPRVALIAGARMILDPPWWAGTWTAAAFLETLPGIGEYRACRLLRRADIPEGRPLALLTTRQRFTLAGELYEGTGR